MQAEEKKRVYRTLFWSTFQLSACTFGGGFVIVPLMRRKFVEGLHWLEEQEMVDITAIAQSAPGPIAVNASILVGYRVAGAPGALVTVLGTVLPPLIIISLISLCYAAFRANPVVNLAMKGLLAGVAAVICDVVWTMGAAVLGGRRAMPAIVLLLAFLAVQVLEVNIMLVIALCGLAGAADTWLRGRRGAGEGRT